ncbi:hypothetical protein PC118_g8935 [Phytophthora cactorum]|uniref:RxLR effector protein n=1 Tax=Phytophthora cactorum TaxID=29920 RepID=A0A8T1G719_9STRA|nr:hypothetical protein PC114_g11735 [Phytophthora cactorum]KAG2984307.1 hypothetical protein PC118_g8935 [Phytophthora cactorum]KAG3037447.1 hypothetical protein PC119_g3626 [Phytophthora cactorum]
MKMFTTTLTALALVAAIANGDDFTQSEVTQQSQENQDYQVGQVSPAFQVGQDSPNQVYQDDTWNIDLRAEAMGRSTY